MLDFSIISGNWELFYHGTLVTLAIALVSLPLAMIAAVPIAILKLSRFWPLRALASVYIEILRNAPFLVVLFIFFYGLPVFGIRWRPEVVGSIVLALYASAYFAEIFRGAYLSVPKGQLEACRAIGMSKFRGVTDIVLPQMIGFLLPPSTNMSIVLLKETSVLALIAVGELTYQGMVVQGTTFAPFEVFITVGIIYWVVSAAIGSLSRLAEMNTVTARTARTGRKSVADEYLLF